MRDKAIQVTEETIRLAEGVIAGAIAYDPECGTPIQYAQALVNGVVANIQFGSSIGLWSSVADREMLFGWAERIGAITVLRERGGN